MSKILSVLGYLLLDLVETVFIAGAVFIVVYFFAFQPHEVSGESMNGKAGFHTGQYILTDKITFKLREPERGEVIVFRYPLNPSFDYIKRIIGLPGETVKIKDGKVTIINTEHPEGFVLDESNYLSTEVVTDPNAFAQEGKEIKIPENEYFVMGDNRPKSADSRAWGLVNKDNIIGRSFFRYIPVNEMGLVKHAKYL
jgi:signal peptidase I